MQVLRKFVGSICGAWLLCVNMLPCAAAQSTSALPPSPAEPAPFESALVPDRGKLPLTAGFNEVDGAGGGGLVPWATITGYGTNRSYGANAHYTAIQLRDFRLQSFGAAIGIADRVELSFAEDTFDVTGTALKGLRVEQHILGAKVRLFGDAVYGQDSWLPQTAVGYEYKKNTGFSRAATVGLTTLTSPTQLGARSDSGGDWYVSAAKVFLAQSLFFNATLRYSEANQFGLLGFGGDVSNHRNVNPEATLAYLVTRKLAVGGEYRGRSRHLSIDNERGAWDAFIAWSATRNVSIVAAYLSLGSILAPVTGQPRDQNGGYISLQVGF